MNDINYAEFYGVKLGEKDFSGAIKRSLKKNIQHLDKKFIKILNKH